MSHFFSGMNGLKATSGLASAQEVELRLLYILKERDDLVLSYHTALKELSKLTARIKDENHLLRQQLNMTDMSHNEIVLALEEQVRVPTLTVPHNKLHTVLCSVYHSARNSRALSILQTLLANMKVASLSGCSVS